MRLYYRILVVSLFLIPSLGFSQSETPTPEQLAQQQLDAYNARDIEAYMETYSDSLEINNYNTQITG